MPAFRSRKRERRIEGGAVWQAMEEVEKAGAAAVVCIVDRLEGAAALFTPKYVYRPLFTIRDFGIEPPG